MAANANRQSTNPEEQAKEGEATATNKEASAIRGAASAFKGWATTFDKERNQAQAESLKRGAQSVGRGVKTATVAVGGAVGKPMLAAAKSSSVILLILGAAHYFLRYFYADSSSLFGLSLVLFLVAGFALAARLERERIAILLPMLMFVIWYWIFNASISLNIILSFLLIGGSIMILVGLLTKGQSIGAELAGLIPVLFLFLDVGLIPFLVEKFSLTITPLIEALVLYMPWWAYLGLFTLPEHPMDNKFLNGFLGLLKFAGIIWIVILILSVSIPLASLNGAYGDTTTKLLPSLGELAKSQQQVTKKIGAGSELLSNLKCLFSDPTDLANCVDKDKTKAKFEATCNEKEDVKSGVTSLDDCVIEEQKKEQTALIQTSGSVDDTIKPTTLSIDIPPAPLQLTTKPAFAVTLMADNPRQLNLDVIVNCTFKKDSTAIKGELSEQGAPAEQLSLKITSDTAQIPLICSPTKDLEAKEKTAYTMVVEATLKGMVTESSLRRAFIGEVSKDQKKEVINKATADHFRSSQEVTSRAPAEFARINFAFGSPEKNPIIASGDVVRFSSSVENVGGGRIIAINSYSYDLPEKGFSSSSATCFTFKKITIPDGAGNKISLDVCPVHLPSELDHFKGDPKVETFYATLNYDYAVKKEASLEIQAVPTE